MQDLHDLEILLKGPVPILVIETHDENRVIALFERLASRIAKPIFKWSVTEGLQRMAEGYRPQTHAREPMDLLSQIKSTPSRSIYLLRDFHPYLDDPMHVRLLKDIALSHEKSGHTVVLISHEINIPPEINRFCARFELSLPTREQIDKAVKEEVRRWSTGVSIRPAADPEVIRLLVDNLIGLPLADVRRLARQAIENDGVLDEKDIPAITKAKYMTLGKDGVLFFEHDTARFSDVGGLAKLKNWLQIRQKFFPAKTERAKIDRPKGILLLGVQGCGKSLAAKAVAGTWALPLLRLDFGTLYNKYYGETERNLRESLKTAEVMAPCILWIDEIEKGIGGRDHDSGVSQRVLGTLLTWLAENKEDVFLVATANDIESLPPELLRKGRFDEIFFVDLPDEKIRRVILEIHVRKRGLRPDRYALDDLAQISTGFSGAELEQVIVSALYAAHARGGSQPTTEHLVQEIRRTRPLSILMAEKINSLRDWAAERTVAAN